MKGTELGMHLSEIQNSWKRTRKKKRASNLGNHSLVNLR